MSVPGQLEFIITKDSIYLTKRAFPVHCCTLSEQFVQNITLVGYSLVFQSQLWEALEMLWFAGKAHSHSPHLLMYHAAPVTPLYITLSTVL